jgi:hypothetical protein
MPDGIEIGTDFMLKEALAQGEMELRQIYQNVLEKIGRTDAFVGSKQCVEQEPNHILAAMWMRGDFKSELLHIMEATRSDSLGEHLEMIRGLPSIVVK